VRLAAANLAPRATVDAKDRTSAEAVVDAFRSKLAGKATCFWADKYDTTPRQPQLKFCTHDPKVDTVISGAIHRYGSWFSGSELSKLAARLPGGRCSPSKPVVLDIGELLVLPVVAERTVLPRALLLEFPPPRADAQLLRSGRISLLTRCSYRSLAQV
jgi:hypothetical protein